MNYLGAIQTLSEQKTAIDAALAEFMQTDPGDDPTAIAMMSLALALVVSIDIQGQTLTEVAKLTA
jgi:hypothetical protein